MNVAVSRHAEKKYLRRADALHLAPTIEDAWRQAHEIPGGRWLHGERARYDPTTRVVLPVRDGVIRTAIYAPTAKPAIRAAVENAGWLP
ncbi:hypothetical protein [Salarchaeum sp. JOR-1]|uniref:hypothetical protein n=1 Tax=Salarchaeum sp. JOR-1 TaxID=2599399 RepID=UPI001198A6AC|nr:hypothetical protein [Salarchaeum sp. JOR-1]QDX39854.1 hypothetical protein FQU85_02675 [Salarchaeum sp. JOR-1]